MKVHCFIGYFIAFLSLEQVSAQSKFCDELVQVGDTFICRDFVGKSVAPAREHYYLYGKMIFTRRWYYNSEDGGYGWTQYRRRGTYAKRHGPSCSFYEDGTLGFSTVYKKGKIVGPSRSYYPTGILKSTCAGYINGLIDGIYLEFHENGAVKSKSKWEKGRLRQILRYKDAQGNNLHVGTFKDGNGTWIKYDYEGNQVFVDTYKNGKVLPVYLTGSGTKWVVYSR
jgi:antitoxin component YwqK of YwqJK toxin-antitoxin module